MHRHCMFLRLGSCGLVWRVGVTSPFSACRFPAGSIPAKVVQRIIKDTRELDATPRWVIALP